MKTKYDVVVLGAGHNGLVAAAYLARAGLSVHRPNWFQCSSASRVFLPTVYAECLCRRMLQDLRQGVQSRRVSRTFCRTGALFQ